MNVRERAKTYEAFMSKSSSMEREKKRVREEGIETGSGISDKKKMVEEGKTKPVPPPRKKKPPEKPEKSYQLQHRSTVTMQIKSPPVVHPKPSKPPPSSDTEKPKTSRKPPPRPAAYQQPSSPSLESKVSQPRTVPKRPSPVTRPMPTVSSPGSPKTSTKGIPKRPPPPSKTSSLPRKPKPPVPPKPTRPVKPILGAGKEKSATLPKTGSLKPENKTEDNKENVEAKDERPRSSTGPYRVSLEKDEEVKTKKMVEDVTKDMTMEGKGTLHLDSSEKSEENVIKQTQGNAEFEEGKETQEIQSHSPSSVDLPKNGEILNEVSLEDKHNRTLNEDILKDDKESETILKEEILENSVGKMDVHTNDIVGSEERYSENRTENDDDVTMDVPSERLEDAQPKEEVEEAKEPSHSVLLKNVDNLGAAELCEQTPFAGDLSLEVEEKTLEVPEEKTVDTTENGEVIANGHLEGDDFENSQSLSNGDTAKLAHSTEPLEESLPADIRVEDSNEKNVEISNGIEVSSSSLVDNSDMIECEDEGVDKSLEMEEEQQVIESAVYDEDKSLLSEEPAVDERKSGEQDEPEVDTIVEEEKDVQQIEEEQQLEVNDVLEATPKEPEQAVDEEKPDQDDSETGEEILEKEKREEALDVGKDTTTEDEQCENLIEKTGETIEKQEMKETPADTTQQESRLEDSGEASFDQSSGVTTEGNLILQGEATEIAVADKLPEQTDETQSSMENMEEVTPDPDHRGELTSEQDVPVDNDSEKLTLTVDNSRDKDTEDQCIEDQTKIMSNGNESVPQTQETISSKTKGVDQENDPFSLDEPIRPRRPSRLKKLAKNNNKEAETIPVSKPLVESQTEESCKEEEPRSKPVVPCENVVLNVSSKEGLPESLRDTQQSILERQSQTEESSKEEQLHSKPVAPYENVVLNVSSKEGLPEPLRDTQQSVPERPSPGYENVILRSEADESPESGSPSIYEVPRRSSFHSHTSSEKMVRKTRPSSIGSLERTSESEYQVPKPRSRTVAAEQTYVMPRPRRLSTESPENGETYVVPTSFRTTSPTQASPVFESEYHVPQSLVREVSTEVEYQVPPRVRNATGSEEEEGVYSVPTTPITVPRGSRTGHSSGSEEEEGVYSVPKSSVSVSGETRVETEKTRQTSECDDEAVYSVPSVPMAEDSEPSSDVALPDGGLRRSSRSSVLTSRDQLPSSFKHAPPKPPRRSILEPKNENQDVKNAQEDEGSKPVPVAVPRSTPSATKQNPESTPRMIPQPKPRHEQADVSSEKNEEELAAPSPPKDHSKSSPKPKRPAPPRPKAPGVSPLMKKEVGETVSSEARNHSAPPRPPPPSVDRMSFAPSEPESVSSVTGLQSESSESESEEEKPLEPTGPPKKKTYFIAHEILSTEKTFVNALTLCYEDCYGLIRSADVVPESVLNDIFKDLGNIYQLDCKFLQELEERMKTWDEHERIGDIVKKYGHFLKMYTTYINNYDKAMNVLQETTKENPQFAELVNQFQASEKCNGLFLISFMLKPVQRIPSYRLLLKDYLKHLPPDSDEFKDIQVALVIVSEVATHINESIKKADNFERVLRIQESLVGNEEIVKPGRDLIKEGVLNKLCRKDMQERMFFLLTDVLLYTAPVGSNQHKLKQKLPLLGMKVTLPESPDFDNEFSIISKMRSFTLSASTPAERDEWIEEVRNAINALADKKKTFLKPKDGTFVVDAEEEEESKIGEKAPVWIPDARVTMCMLCTDNFTVTNRRHHCRGCGKVVCGSCSDNLAPLAYLDYVQARVCEVCYDFLLKEQNKSETSNDFERLPASPLGMTNEDLDRIHRKPPKFEILHRFKPGSRSHAKRKSKAFGRPSVCTEVVGHDSGSQMSGYLKFKRTNKHGWKRLWFVLKDNVLYTYKASEDVVAIETIPILGYVVQEATRTEDEIQFQLKHAGLPPITFKTESESSVSRWIQELKKATTL